jgi:PAS domain S-box-containing protein
MPSVEAATATGVTLSAQVGHVIHHPEDVRDTVGPQQQEVEQDTTVPELSARSEEPFRELLDTAPDAMVVVGDDARIRFVNIRAEKLFGYARADLLGQNVELLIPERLRRDDAVRIAGVFANQDAREMTANLELLGCRKDGTELPLEVSVSTVDTEQGTTVSASIRDISERKRLEALAELNADRLGSALDSMQEGLAILDDHDRLILCNKVYRRLLGESLAGPPLGKSSEKLLEAWLGELSFKDDGERDHFRAERLAPLERTTTFDVCTRDGRTLRTMFRGTPEGGLVKTIWDITDDIRLNAQLCEARDAAEASSNAKSDFLSSMSHELRTPLNAILGFAQLLQRDKKEPLSQRHKARIEHILKGGEHLLRLIDDILDLSRIEAGGVSISPEPVSVVDVLDEVRRTLESMAAANGVRLELVVPADPRMVVADRTRFVQILVNFGSNAVKYNRPAGSVAFIVSSPAADHVRITVKDTGLGIPLEKQTSSFSPFKGRARRPARSRGRALVW